MSRIGRSQGVSNDEDVGGRGYTRKKGGKRVFGPTRGSTNGVANEYRVWIHREPIGVRDVLPRSREKRQSGVFAGGVALGVRRVMRVERKKGNGRG